jgi:hypothetical protein
MRKELSIVKADSLTKLYKVLTDSLRQTSLKSCLICWERTLSVRTNGDNLKELLNEEDIVGTRSLR